MANHENETENEAPQVYLLGKTHLINNQGQFYIRNDPIVNMAAGDQHTIIVTASGRAFAFGDNTSGQLGLGHTDKVEKVSCIKTLKFGDSGERVILAACGRESSLVATNRGSIYGFGSNSRSQLALESTESTGFHSTPVKIEQFKGRINWKQISMGAEHACALTDDGIVYVWGANDEGQCGQIKKHEIIKVPRNLRVNSEKYPVTAISCGYYHTALITEDGRLFVFGSNTDRQLGRSVADQYGGPEEVSIPDPVKAIACGNQHTVVLTEKGEVYTCGHGDRGQLGLGSRVHSSENFELVPNLPKRLTAIAAGEGHTAIIGARGDMYVFGDGKHGKLGSTTHSNEFEACLVEKFKSFNVSRIVCGGCQTIVLAQKKTTEHKKSSGSEEDIGNTTLSITQRPKSRARNIRNQTLTDRMHNVGDSVDTTIQHVKPLGASNHLRTERNHESDDDEKSDKELSESLKSATFNQTHTLTNGRLRPTQTPSLNRTSIRTNDEDSKLLRTGALDRTVRLNKDADDLTKTNNRLPSLDKSPVHNTHTYPVNTKKKPISDDDDKSSSEDSKPSKPAAFDRTARLNKDADDLIKTNNRLPSLDKSPARNTNTNPVNIRKKPISDDDKSASSEEDKVRKQPSFTKKPEQPPRDDRRRSPERRQKDENDSDDNRYKRPSPVKTPMSEKLVRKTTDRRDRSEDEEEEEDDDEENNPRLSDRRSKQPPPPPTVTRRGSLPPQPRVGTSVPPTRDGNQTIGSKPVDDVRGSFRSPATKTLAKPTATTSSNDSIKKETPPAPQPGFFSRIFGSKATPPPPPPPPPPPTPPTVAAPPATNANSKACSIM